PARWRSPNSNVRWRKPAWRCAMSNEIRPPFDPDSLAWDKQDGLLPVIVQQADTLRVLMLGYMDRAALAATLDTGRVTFFSRSKQRLWTKGESSGHFLQL